MSVGLNLPNIDYKLNRRDLDLFQNDNSKLNNSSDKKALNFSKIKKSILMPISRSLININKQRNVDKKDINVNISQINKNKPNRENSLKNEAFDNSSHLRYQNDKSTHLHGLLKYFDNKSKFDCENNCINAVLTAEPSSGHNIASTKTITVFKKYHTKFNSYNDSKAAILPRIKNGTVVVDSYNLLWKISHNKVDTKRVNSLTKNNHHILNFVSV